jgi:SAM-dependent methyltransferase
MRHGEFRDARLAAYYDVAFPWTRDDDFFMSVVNQNGAAWVLDLGCGTGRLALAMTAAGHSVTGIEPARASLDAARAKPGAGQVTWIEGTAADLPRTSFDVAVMTSHVAQFLVGDAEWAAALASLHTALVPGGRLVFDSRDPRDRAWERWNPADSRQRTTMPDGREIEAWTEVTAVQSGAVRDSGVQGSGIQGSVIQASIVSFTIHYAYPGAGDLVSTADLRFRTEGELRSSLRQAGFTVEQIYGGWSGQPAGAGDGEFLVIARAQPPARVD